MTGFVVRGDPEGRPVPPLGLEVFLPVPDAQAFAAAARDWFAELPGLLAPGEWAEVLRNGKPPFTGRPQMLWPGYDDWVEPFMAWGEIVVAPLRWNRVWQRRVTRSSLEWLSEVLADRPVSAHIRIGRVDAAGIELPGAVMVAADAALGRRDELIPVGRLAASDSLMWRPGARLEDADELRERQARAARAWAARPGLLGLFAGEEIPHGWGTALTAGLEPRLSWERAALERELQGYSWITLCPAGPAARLGGAAMLRDSGAFWRVAEQPDGAVLLQATEHVGDYDLAAAGKAFDVLAAELPDGLPEKPPEWPEDVPWLVVGEDPSWRREGRSPLMGASGWSYVTRYRGDVGAALRELQERVFGDGDYSWWDEFGEYEPRPGSVEDIWDSKQGWVSGTHSILDIDRGADTADQPASGGDDHRKVRPLAADAVTNLFGTARPSPAQFKAIAQDHDHPLHRALMAQVGVRWTGRYVLLYDEDTPTQIGFWGFSGE